MLVCVFFFVLHYMSIGFRVQILYLTPLFELFLTSDLLVGTKVKPYRSVKDRVQAHTAFIGNLAVSVTVPILEKVIRKKVGKGEILVFLFSLSSKLNKNFKY